jgi:hypothetical protein
MATMVMPYKIHEPVDCDERPSIWSWQVFIFSEFVMMLSLIVVIWLSMVVT